MRKIILRRKAVEEFRRIAREDWGREMTFAEARAAAQRFLADIANAHEVSVPHAGPRFVPGPPTECCLCRSAKRDEPVSETEHGALCAACAEAIEDGTLPAWVTTEGHRWRTGRQLCEEYGTTPARIAALVRHGKLVARTVQRTGFRLFLADDQPQSQK